MHCRTIEERGGAMQPGFGFGLGSARKSQYTDQQRNNYELRFVSSAIKPGKCQLDFFVCFMGSKRPVMAHTPLRRQAKSAS